MVVENGSPIVFTIRECDSCVRLLKKWHTENIHYDERRVELSQATLDEARQYGSLVPSSSGVTAELNRHSKTVSAA